MGEMVAKKKTKERKKNLTLTIYLLKKSISEIESILKQDLTFKVRKLIVERVVIGKLYAKLLPSHPPNWLNPLRPYLDEGLDLRTASTQGLLLVKTTGGSFGITLGYGKSLLPDDSYEERFGLRVTLNAVDIEKMRSIDGQSLDAIGSQRRIQTRKESPLEDFGINVENDLLKAVTGRPEEPTLGKQLTGTDALQVTVPANVEEIPRLLDLYHSVYKKTTYKEKFPWVDRLNEVRNEKQIEDLNQRLVTKLRQANNERIWMAAPDILDWTGIEGFRYTTSSQEAASPDLEVSEFLKTLREPKDLNIDTLKSHHIFSVDRQSEQTRDHWTVFKCLYCEFDINDEVYVLNNGKWYRVIRSFVQEVESVISSIPTTDLNLGSFTGYKDEGSYNRAMAGIHKMALMDGEIIQKPGKVEFCDLYTKSKQMIHIKRYGGSSVLSHLFAQGMVSGRLFLSESAFRRQV
jgi:uncharacterized protein (TIGR04141 family)